jgi:hypothetical protein
VQSLLIEMSVSSDREVTRAAAVAASAADSSHDSVFNTEFIQGDVASTSVGEGAADGSSSGSNEAPRSVSLAVWFQSKFQLYLLYMARRPRVTNRVLAFLCLCIVWGCVAPLVLGQSFSYQPFYDTSEKSWLTFYPDFEARERVDFNDDRVYGGTGPQLPKGLALSSTYPFFVSSLCVSMSGAAVFVFGSSEISQTGWQLQWLIGLYYFVAVTAIMSTGTIAGLMFLFSNAYNFKNFMLVYSLSNGLYGSVLKNLLLHHFLFSRGGVMVLISEAMKWNIMGLLRAMLKFELCVLVAGSVLLTSTWLWSMPVGLQLFGCFFCTIATIHFVVSILATGVYLTPIYRTLKTLQRFKTAHNGTVAQRSMAVAACGCFASVISTCIVYVGLSSALIASRHHGFNSSTLNVNNYLAVDSAINDTLLLFVSGAFIRAKRKIKGRTNSTILTMLRRPPVRVNVQAAQPCDGSAIMTS